MDIKTTGTLTGNHNHSIKDPVDIKIQSENKDLTKIYNEYKAEIKTLLYESSKTLTWLRNKKGDPSPQLKPIEVKPIQTEPIKIEPIQVSPIKAVPVQIEPIKIDPITTEPIKISIDLNQKLDTKLIENLTEALKALKKYDSKPSSEKECGNITSNEKDNYPIPWNKVPFLGLIAAVAAYVSAVRIATINRAAGKKDTNKKEIDKKEIDKKEKELKELEDRLKTAEFLKSLILPDLFLIISGLLFFLHILITPFTPPNFTQSLMLFSIFIFLIAITALIKSHSDAWRESRSILKKKFITKIILEREIEKLKNK